MQPHARLLHAHYCWAASAASSACGPPPAMTTDAFSSSSPMSSMTDALGSSHSVGRHRVRPLTGLVPGRLGAAMLTRCTR